MRYLKTITILTNARIRFSSKVDKDNGILYLGDGAWGVGVEVHKPDGKWYLAKAESRNHFWLVTLTDKTPRYQAIDQKGVVFDDYEDERGWRSGIEK